MKPGNHVWTLLFCLLMGVGVAGAQDGEEASAEEAAPAEAQGEPAAAESEPAMKKEEAQADTAQEAPARAGGEVARAAFTTGIQDREPVDQVDSMTAETDTIYFFSELKDLEGQTVVHQWKHDGEVMAEVSFDVGGPRWRVWSTKKLLPTWTGEWTVSVVNSAGEVIETQQFQYEPAPEADTAESQQAEPADAAAETDETGADVETGPEAEPAAEPAAE